MSEERVEQVHIADMYPVMAEQLAAGGSVTFGPKGTSMLPLIVQGRDSVTLVRPPERLKKYDIPFYRRSSGQFVLHRVVKVNKDGTYTMCGDNQWEREKGIPHSAVIGVVSELIINGKSVSVHDAAYMRYCRRQVGKRSILRYKVLIKRGLKRLLRKD